MAVNAEISPEWCHTHTTPLLCIEQTMGLSVYFQLGESLAKSLHVNRMYSKCCNIHAVALLLGAAYFLDWLVIWNAPKKRF